MKSFSLAAAVCAAALGSMLSTPPASAGPLCPDCFYPYRACMRAAGTPADQLICEALYDECRANYCESTAAANDALRPRVREQATPVDTARIFDTRQSAR